MLSKAVATCSGLGFSFIRGGWRQSHLFFVDDSIVFLRVAIEDCFHVKNIIKSYCEMSGQLVNFDKPEASFSANLDSRQKQLLCNIFGVKVMSKETKYLGLPSFWGKSKTEACAFLCSKLGNKLLGWKQALLSYAGKEILIKSVAQAIPAYFISCFALPFKILQQIKCID